MNGFPQWQPISTCPQDGRVVIGAYTGQRPFEMYPGPHGDWLDARGRIHNPDYWMPLPPPPQPDLPVTEEEEAAWRELEAKCNPT